MPDSKITALTALTSADPANDMFPIVDVSDTSMAASGTTKRISINNLLAASGTATLASATITGDLTVATSALKVVSASNRVLINQAAAIQGDSLEISAKSDGGTISLFGRASDNGATLAFRANGATTAKASLTANDNGLSIRTGTVERYNIDTTGVSTWSVGGSTAMTLNSTGLGIGASPTQALFISRAGAAAIQIVNSSDSINALFGVSTTEAFLTSPNRAFVFNVAGSERLRIDTSGNVGIGVTPSAGGGCLQLKSGITFPATQVASSDANTLDDYEEGTFTPTIVGTTTAGTGTYSTQQGRYTKIGNQVSVHIFLDWSAHTGTGNLKLAGLPFQSSNNFHACSIGFWNNIAVTAANIPMAYVINQETNVALLQMPSGGGAMAAIPMDTAGSFVLSATYTV